MGCFKSKSKAETNTGETTKGSPELNVDDVEKPV